MVFCYTAGAYRSTCQPLNLSSYLLEVIVGKENNVFPMVPQGRGVAEVVLSKDEL